mgnify:CR=1 FL=1
MFKASVVWILIVMTYALGVMVKQGIAQTEVNECTMWLQQQNQYTRWYATGWQIDQCKHYGVELEQSEGEADRTVVIPK